MKVYNYLVTLSCAGKDSANPPYLIQCALRVHQSYLPTGSNNNLKGHETMQYIRSLLPPEIQKLGYVVEIKEIASVHVVGEQANMRLSPEDAKCLTDAWNGVRTAYDALEELRPAGGFVAST